ncbi:Inosine-5'-monophosphate dehydrogenase [Roseovarius sp. THAF9]|uniref:CBS domain-containing protein n=1 Tax=Roseovarius sp. THAF9 TaxID=2587847 RepID=UPI001268607F|nr:CBS domain-containing protein [Roseovarius sp. THAF9]QFT91398.1 Inosine-5'-monophosphate dehydrogenase [Roseovarius sp. THAF9]
MPDHADRPGNRLMDRPEYASKPKPLTRLPDTSAYDAAKAMAEKNFGSVIVVDSDDKVVGVVTERDMMNKLVAGERDAKTTKLSEIMTENPRVARETDDMIDWLRMMSNERFRRLPVVDEEGRIQAVLTQGDFVSYTWPDLMHQVKSIATATISKNWAVFLIGGGIAVYSVVIIALVSSLS